MPDIVIESGSRGRVIVPSCAIRTNRHPDSSRIRRSGPHEHDRYGRSGGTEREHHSVPCRSTRPFHPTIERPHTIPDTQPVVCREINSLRTPVERPAILSAEWACCSRWATDSCAVIAPNPVRFSPRVVIRRPISGHKLLVGLLSAACDVPGVRADGRGRGTGFQDPNRSCVRLVTHMVVRDVNRRGVLRPNPETRESIVPGQALTATENVAVSDDLTGSVHLSSNAGRVRDRIVLNIHIRVRLIRTSGLEEESLRIGADSVAVLILHGVPQDLDTVDTSEKLDAVIMEDSCGVLNVSNNVVLDQAIRPITDRDAILKHPVEIGRES